MHVEDLEEIADEISRIIRSLNYENVLVVVEGMRDARTLRAFGYEGEIFEFSGNGRGFVKLIDKAKGFSRIVILIDTDKRGRAFEEGIKRRLNGMGINLDFKFRKILKRKAQGFTQLEELSRYVPYLKRSL